APALQSIHRRGTRARTEAPLRKRIGGNRDVPPPGESGKALRLNHKGHQGNTKLQRICPSCDLRVLRGLKFSRGKSTARRARQALRNSRSATSSFAFPSDLCVLCG